MNFTKNILAAILLMNSCFFSLFAQEIVIEKELSNADTLKRNHFVGELDNGNIFLVNYILKRDSNLIGSWDNYTIEFMLLDSSLNTLKSQVIYSTKPNGALNYINAEKIDEKIVIYIADIDSTYNYVSINRFNVDTTSLTYQFNTLTNYELYTLPLTIKGFVVDNFLLITSGPNFIKINKKSPSSANIKQSNISVWDLKIYNNNVFITDVGEFNLSIYDTNFHFSTHSFRQYIFFNGNNHSLPEPYTDSKSSGIGLIPNSNRSIIYGGGLVNYVFKNKAGQKAIALFLDKYLNPTDTAIFGNVDTSIFSYPENYSAIYNNQLYLAGSVFDRMKLDYFQIYTPDDVQEDRGLFLASLKENGETNWYRYYKMDGGNYNVRKMTALKDGGVLLSVSMYDWHDTIPHLRHFLYRIADTNHYDNNTSVSPVSIHKEELRVYPNPSENFVYFEFDKTIHANLDIYSIDGKLIKSLRINNSLNTLDVSDFNKGIYIYKIHSNSINQSGKFSVY